MLLVHGSAMAHGLKIWFFIHGQLLIAKTQVKYLYSFGCGNYLHFLEFVKSCVNCGEHHNCRTANNQNVHNSFKAHVLC